eukprot:4391063-Ditylum_brightwellii.AAC.1
MVMQQQIGIVERQLQEAIRMNLTGYPKARAIAVSCLETSLGFLSTVNNFISDTYRDLDSSGFPSATTWQLATKLVYQDKPWNKGSPHPSFQIHVGYLLHKQANEGVPIAGVS